MAWKALFEKVVILRNAKVNIFTIWTNTETCDLEFIEKYFHHWIVWLTQTLVNTVLFWVIIEVNINIIQTWRVNDYIIFMFSTDLVHDKNIVCSIEMFFCTENRFSTRISANWRTAAEAGSLMQRDAVLSKN